MIRNEIFAPNITWTIPGHHPLAGTKQGADEVFAFFQQLAKAKFKAEVLFLDFPKSLKGKSVIEPAYKDLFRGYGKLKIRNLTIYPMLDPDRFVAEWRSEIELIASETLYTKGI